MSTMDDMKKSVKRLYYGRAHIDVDFYFVANEGDEDAEGAGAADMAVDDSDWRYDMAIDVDLVREDHKTFWPDDAEIYTNGHDSENTSLGFWLKREAENRLHDEFLKRQRNLPLGDDES